MNNDNFKWTDELVKEFAERWHGNRHYNDVLNELMPKFISQFKASHTSTNEKDWEIVKMFDGGIGTHDEDNYCKMNGCAIHSVRRKSDNTIWTVGETVGFLQKPITRFSIREEDGVMWVNGWGFGCPLSDVTKAQPLPQRTKLLTTEDGVDLFKGDTFWYTNTHVWETYEQVANEDSVHGLLVINKYIPFSNEKLARNFHVMNKPCLSVNDVREMWTSRDFIGTQFFEDKLKQLAKSKL